MKYATYEHNPILKLRNKAAIIATVNNNCKDNINLLF